MLIRIVYLSVLIGSVFRGVSVYVRASCNVMVACKSSGESIGLPYLFVIAMTGAVLSTPPFYGVIDPVMKIR